MRVILVPVADRPECAVALNKSFALARDLDASVIGCHIRPPEERSAGSATVGIDSGPPPGGADAKLGEVANGWCSAVGD